MTAHSGSAADGFSPRAIEALLRNRLERVGPATREAEAVAHGDHDLGGFRPGQIVNPDARPAAVLVPIIAREPEVTVLLTQRAASLRQHSGQIAFPGGKLDPGESEVEAALREANEEVGLDPAGIATIGLLDPYFTGTGFRITPVVAMVRPQPALVLNAGEVEDAFEVPLSFLLDAANHQIHSREVRGAQRSFYAMPFGDRYIWGATAGIIRRLYERLL